MSVCAWEASNLEQLGITHPDLFAVLLDACGIVLQRLDVLERPVARLLFGLRMHRAQATDIDDELLALRGETIALEQPRRVRIRRILEYAVRPNDQRRAFAGVQRLDRLAGLAKLEQVVFVAVGLHGAFA